MRKNKRILTLVFLVAFVTLLVGCWPVKNQAPVITSTPVKTATVGVEYTYDVNATDPDNDVLTYSLDVKPTGMIITSTNGLIKWTPATKGDYAVIVKVSDGDLDITQSFTIAVSAVEPEPELELIGIEVDPKTMDLIVGGSDTIDSVTACYEVKGYEVDIALEDCLILTSNSKVATVKTVVGDENDPTTVTVTAVAEGTANIVVSYKGKIDTLKVTVEYLPMELIVDMPIFEVNITEPLVPGEPVEYTGVPDIFTVEVIANSDLNKDVKFYFTLPEPWAVDTTVYTIEWLLENGIFVDLKDFPLYEIGTYDPLTGEVVIGEHGEAEALIDNKITFKGTFNEAGTYSTTLEVRTYPGDILLCSKIITATVVLVYVPPEG